MCPINHFSKKRWVFVAWNEHERIGLDDLDSEQMHQWRMVLLSADLLDNRGNIDVCCRLNYFFFISSSDRVRLGRIVMPGQSRRCILSGRWDRCAQSLFMTIECAEQQRTIVQIVWSIVHRCNHSNMPLIGAALRSPASVSIIATVRLSHPMSCR